jgi:hypothetical protein
MPPGVSGRRKNNNKTEKEKSTMATKKKTTAAQVVEVEEKVNIKPINFRTYTFTIEGTAPYVQNRFWNKGPLAEHMAHEGQKTTKKKAPRVYEKEYLAAMHLGYKGEPGIPAAAFRAAMISACRLVGFKMTLAKLSVFVEADDFCQFDNVPLVNIISDVPLMSMDAVRVSNGQPDVRARPMWREWKAKVKVKYDGDLFSFSDIVNLLDRCGQQVGIGEGRPDSKQSTGMGWGTFRVSEADKGMPLTKKA